MTALSPKLLAHLLRRQEGLLDTPLLSSTGLIQIGVGRGVGFVELMAGNGIAAFDLIDKQVVAVENVGLSPYRCTDIGKPKVIAARDRIHDINPRAQVSCFEMLAGDVPDLDALFRKGNLIKIGVDDPKAQFDLADRAQRSGTDAIVAGTTGDNSQWFVAGVLPDGPPLRKLLPEAWRGVEAGYTPPDFFRSCGLNAASLNIQAARIALGLVHHRAGSKFPIAEIGAEFCISPLVIGSNGMHAPSGFLTPTRFMPQPAG